MGCDLGEKKATEWNCPCLIAEEFCISSASVLSFLGNPTICFSNSGLKHWGESQTIASNVLIVFEMLVSSPFCLC